MGGVSSPWAPFGGPTKHIIFFGLLKTLYEKMHLSEIFKL